MREAESRAPAPPLYHRLRRSNTTYCRQAQRPGLAQIENVLGFHLTHGTLFGVDIMIFSVAVAPVKGPPAPLNRAPHGKEGQTSEKPL
jgi:hypothetical protein